MKNLLMFFLCMVVITIQAQEVSTIAGTGQAGGADGPAATATFNNPHGIATDNQGTIYVADRYGHKIRKITPSGIVTTLAGSGNVGNADGTGTAASFNEPWAICVGSDDNIYVTDTKNNLIRKITPQGVVTTFAGNGSFGITDGPAASASFGYPTGIEMDADGNLYVADHLTHTIRKISSDGTVSRLAGSPYCSGLVDGEVGQSLFNRPYGLTIDLNGNIIVADEWNHAIRSVSPDGKVTTLAGNGAQGHVDGSGTYSTFNYPWDVTVDNSGNIFVIDGYNHAIRKLIPTASVPIAYGTLTFAGVPTVSGWVDGYGTESKFNGAAGIHYCKESGEVFVGDTYNNKIRKIIDHNEQSVLLNIIDNDFNVICTTDGLKAEAFPAAFDTYIFLVDGQIVQSGGAYGCNLPNISQGEHTISVHATNTNGTYVSSEFPFTVLEAPTPLVEVDGELPMPQESSVVLGVNENDVVSCSWSTGENTPNVVVDQPDVVTVNVLYTNGCFALSAPVNIQQYCSIETPLIEFETIITTTGSCFLDPVEMITDYEQGEIQWLFNGNPITGANGNSYEASETGTYQIIVTTFQQQVYSNTLTAEFGAPIIENLTANKTLLFENDDEVKFKAEVFDNSNDNYTYAWNFGDFYSGLNNFSNKKNPKHRFTGVGVYSIMLTVTDVITGCSQTIYRPDMIIYAEGVDGGSDDRTNILYIPTAFSPNGDGENDVLYVRGEEINKLEFYVYNQRGKKVFESRDQNTGWDGNIEGRPAKNETYNYVVKAKMNNGTTENRNGKVFVIR